MITEGDARRVAWIDLDRKEETVLTDGPDDRSPHWLPDNDHVVFLRGGKIHLVSKSTKKTIVLDSPASVSNILAVGGESGTHIIYTASSTESPEESPVYMLDLDEGLRPKGSIRMIYSPNWFLSGWTSPDGREVLFWKDATIYRVPAEKSKRHPRES